MEEERVRQLETEIAAHLEHGALEPAARSAIEGFGPSILLYLRGVLQDEDAAQDVFGHFAEKLWVGLSGFRRMSSFRTWAHSIAWNAAQDHLRDRFRRRGRRLETSEAEALAGEVRSRTPLFMGSAARGRLLRLKDSLSEEERALLLLRVEQSMPWKEVAEALSLPEAAVRKRFERLKKKLRELASKESA